MNLTHTAYLLQQYQTGRATDAEWEELAMLLTDAGNDEAIKEALQQAMEQHTTGVSFLDRDYQALLQKITSVDQAPAQRQLRVRSNLFLRKWGWVAAAAVLLLLVGGLYLRYNQPAVPPTVITAEKEILPGQQGAILTLANGRKIVLDTLNNGVIAQQDAKLIVLNNGVIKYDRETTLPDRETISYNTLSTPRGRQYQLTLPDGTNVWLNAESTITFPVAFTGNTRQVSITGEAYFEVTQDKTKPFIVDVAGKTSIEVLGTNFNVNAYKDEPAEKITLIEGSVKVVNGQWSMANEKTAILKPGEQAELAEAHSPFTIHHSPDLEQIMAWKNGLFVLQGANLEEVIRQLARWYDIDIRYESAVPSFQFEGKMDRGVKLPTVIKWFTDLGIPCHLEKRTLVIGK